MADETTTNTNAQGAEPTQEQGHDGQSSGGVRTFTQEQLDAIVVDRLTRDRRERKNTIDTLTKERDDARAKVEQYEREKVLLSKGVAVDDLDYYVFKIGKLVTDDKDFEAAADEFLAAEAGKNNRKNPTARMDTSAALGGGGTDSTPNDTMNALIRGARK